MMQPHTWHGLACCHTACAASPPSTVHCRMFIGQGSKAGKGDEAGGGSGGGGGGQAAAVDGGMKQDQQKAVLQAFRWVGGWVGRGQAGGGG